MGAITLVERKFEKLFELSGSIVVLFAQALMQTRLARRDVQRILRLSLSVGYTTAPLALLIGMFVGMTLALNTGLALKDWNQTGLIAPIVVVSLMREMGPVITAVIVVGRVGSAMTAALGTMAVNDEIDVLRMLGIRIDRYLVMPRLIASLVMLPLLTVYSVCIGLLGSAWVANAYFNEPFSSYYDDTFNTLDGETVWKGLLKTVVFAAIFASVCCHMGIQTRGGAEGVGRSTTRAVVVSLSAILVANYLLTSFLFR